MSPALRSLRIADPPDRWRALGFNVREGRTVLGDVTVEIAPSGRGPAEREGGVVSWVLEGIAPVDSIDGLVTEVSKSALASAPVEHGNGALGIDHVVVTTPDFNRTAAALAEVGMELRRIRELPGGSRQGFRRVGPAILELVEAPAEDASGPARFWGLVVVVSDLDRLAERLSPLLGRVKPAVQPGRRIATLGAAAGVSPAVAFMTPEP